MGYIPAVLMSFLLRVNLKHKQNFTLRNVHQSDKKVLKRLNAVRLRSLQNSSTVKLKVY